MSKYKLYRVTIEKEFVVAASADDDIRKVERSVDSIMLIHGDSLLSEGCEHVLAREIKDTGDLPGGWEPACLPYVNYSNITMPADLRNKTIKDILEENGTN